VNAAKEMRKEAMSHFEKDLDVYPMRHRLVYLHGNSY